MYVTELTPSKQPDQFTVEFFLYNWLLLIIGEIISRNQYFFFVFKRLPLITRANHVKPYIKLPRLWFRVKKFNFKTNIRVKYIFLVIITINI